MNCEICEDSGYVETGKWYFTRTGRECLVLDFCECPIGAHRQQELDELSAKIEQCEQNLEE